MTKTELIMSRLGQTIHLDIATVERLREEAERKEMEFLGAVLVNDGRVIRICFRDAADFISRDVQRYSQDPSLDIFRDYMRHDVVAVNGGPGYYIEYHHRPN